MTATGESLEWSGCRNARDVGGLETRDGRRVRPRALLRTDRLDQLDVNGQRTVRELRPGLVADVRSEFEMSTGKHPFGDDPAYRWLPFVDPSGEPTAPWPGTSLAERYRGALDRNGAQVARIVEAIADAPAGPVIVHCVSGKDRTGILVALLLQLVGVPDDDICADYARSEECLDLSGHDDPYNRTSPQTMAEVLGYLESRWGGARGYLKAHGLEDGTLDQLARRLLDE